MHVHVHVMYLLWFWSVHHSVAAVKLCARLVFVEARLVGLGQHVHATK